MQLIIRTNKFAIVCVQTMRGKDGEAIQRKENTCLFSEKILSKLLEGVMTNRNVF